MEPEDDELLFPCVVCGEESDSLLCTKCWEDYKRLAGIVNGEPDEG